VNQPEGLQRDLLKCSRASREWVLSLSAAIEAKDLAFCAAMAKYNEREAEIARLTAELKAAQRMILERDVSKQVSTKAIRLLIVATGSEADRDASEVVVTAAAELDRLTEAYARITKRLTAERDEMKRQLAIAVECLEAINQHHLDTWLCKHGTWCDSGETMVDAATFHCLHLIRKISDAAKETQ